MYSPQVCCLHDQCGAHSGSNILVIIISLIIHTIQQYVIVIQVNTLYYQCVCDPKLLTLLLRY